MRLEENKKENSEAFTKLIESLLDQKLAEYDDLTRAITKESDKTERAALIEDLKGVGTTIADLLGELPDVAPTIHIVNGKVQ